MSLSQKTIYWWAFLIMSATQCLAQPAEQINWHADSLLTWNDFKGPIDSGSSFSAYTYYGASYQYKWHEHLGKYTFTFTTKSYALPDKCWSKVDKQTPALLKHEQLHFDITEFFARQLLIALNAHTYSSNYKAEIKQVNDEIVAKRQAMQELYDNQTNHSINKIMQARWELYIDNLLRNPFNLDDAIALAPVSDHQP
jgi:hypothetical protein